MRQGLRIVRVDQDDEPRVAALHRRCSATARWHRYHRAMGDPDTYLGPLLSRPHAVHLAVQDSLERLVAIGHLLPDDGDAEAALLVEDTWQNKGLGTRLLGELGRFAVELGVREVYGVVHPDDARMAAVLLRAGVPLRTVPDTGSATTVRARTQDIGLTSSPARCGWWRRSAGKHRVSESSVRSWDSEAGVQRFLRRFLEAASLTC
ncbi:GNAT superfamily N-acetyltransferase [Streptomyces sp. SAI-208]|uniref:GNAT family N-acetyltransferase n=1 Tax=Streptomyces sp. SAI-208 TaxID=2940550 RepID=UPI002473E46F|nr:GNAT family N-acetyltransferase [Streptomyces sp. SAI-208]MDH6612550.1 GNAT superfamily N-acetyltransferase [Streptomyces sp. SAI-208]